MPLVTHVCDSEIEHVLRSFFRPSLTRLFETALDEGTMCCFDRAGTDEYIHREVVLKKITVSPAMPRTVENLA